MNNYNLRGMAAAILSFRHNWLFEPDETNQPPFNTEYYLLALNALEQAQLFAKLAVQGTNTEE